MKYKIIVAIAIPVILLLAYSIWKLIQTIRHQKDQIWIDRFAIKANRKEADEWKFAYCKLKEKGWVKLAFSLFINNIKIKGVNMATVVKKSQFKDDGSGNLVLHAHIEPVTDSGQLEKVEDGTQTYLSNNESVATVDKDPSDPNKLVVTWQGPGDVQIQATADANLSPDKTDTIGGTLDLTLEEDEATKLNIVLDDVVS